MIMNYVLSFCKITAASRVFSRNFYLPLLKPLTPKDALRTLKITGKWLLGSKIQHYIPVLDNHKRKRSKRYKNYGRLKHKYDDSFTYMAPRFDEENENHLKLKNVIESKSESDDCRAFIYTVDDKMCNIVFPGRFELAIRDGDIIDVLVSQSDDKVLIKMKDFKKIPVPLQYYDKEDINSELIRGEGATTLEEEKFHHHGKMTMKLAKIFEAKEMAEEWEQEMMKIVAKKKRQKGEGTKEWEAMVSQSIENINWQQFEVEAKKVIDQIWEPAHEEHIGMEVEDLQKTRNVSEFFNRNAGGFLRYLPNLADIPDVVNNMATAVYDEIEDDTNGHRISGVRVTMSNGKDCFITGQMVKTEDGDIFIPGQTIENEFGLSYAPGMTVLLDGKPHLVKGLIMGEDSPNEEDKRKPMFLPTESSITADGALTFCRNPEELSKAQPHKIFVKRRNPKNKKKSKKEKSASPTAMTNGLLKDMEAFQVGVNDLDVIVESDELLEEDKDEHKSLITEVIPVIEPIITVEPIGEKTQSQEDLEEFLKLERLLELQELQEIENGTSQQEAVDEAELLRESNEEFSFKNPDDGMEKLIENLEDKKSELQRKIEQLRQLSVTLENSVTYVQLQDAEVIAKQLTPVAEQQHKIAEVLFALTRQAYMFRERMTVNIKNIENLSIHTSTTSKSLAEHFDEIDSKFEDASLTIKRTLMSALFAANEVFKRRPKDQVLALKTLSAIVQNEIGDDPRQIGELCSLSMERDEVVPAALRMLTQKVRECRINLLHSLVDDFDAEKCTAILDANVLATAFRTLVKNSPVVSETLQMALRPKIGSLRTEPQAKDLLQQAIHDACACYAKDLLMNFNVRDDFEYTEMIQEAQGLAATLSLWDVQEQLLSSKPDLLQVVQSHKARAFLERYMLIKQLCQKDFSVKSSLERLRKHPECGRKDPRIRKLLLESACLMSQGRDLRSSLEVPLHFFKEQNFLAIEDCVYLKRWPERAVLVSRKGIQAVVPKEERRNVLAGRVAYTLIDETGITHFKPMHMFKMNENKKHSIYRPSALRRTSLNDARMAA